MSDQKLLTDSESRQSLLVDRVGSLLFFAGIFLFLFWFIAQDPDASFSLPGFWYRNVRLWPILAIVLSGDRIFFLMQREPAVPDSWEPSLAGQRFQRVIIYTREECHLCDVAKDTLHRFSRWLPTIEEIDIETDPELRQRFQETIPVVEIDGRERFSRDREFDSFATADRSHSPQEPSVLTVGSPVGRKSSVPSVASRYNACNESIRVNMSTTLPSQIPDLIEQSFARLSRRMSVLIFLRGFGRWITLTVALLVVILASDWLFDWNSVVRSALFWVSLVLMIAAAIKLIVFPLTRSLNPTEHAALIDLQYPELRERLMSTVEFCDPNIPEEYKGSALMRDRVVRETLESLPHVDVDRTIPVAPTKAALLVAGLALMGLGLPFLIGPNHYRLLWSRLLVPTGNYDSASNLFFEVKDAERIVARGASMDFVVTPRWRYFETTLPETVWLIREDQEGRVDRSRLILDEQESIYSLTLPAVHHSFDYHVASEQSRSRHFQIRVEDAPEIATARVEVEPPAYTGRAVETFSTINGRLNAFERSRVNIELAFNKPVATVQFFWSEDAVPLQSKRLDRSYVASGTNHRAPPEAGCGND